MRNVTAQIISTSNKFLNRFATDQADFARQYSADVYYVEKHFNCPNEIRDVLAIACKTKNPNYPETTDIEITDGDESHFFTLRDWQCPEFEKFLTTLDTEKQNGLYKSISLFGYTIEISIDHNPPNPINKIDNIGKMVCYHPTYFLGDRHDFGTDPDAYHFWEDLKAEISNTHDTDLIIPLYLSNDDGLKIHTTKITKEQYLPIVGFVYTPQSKIIEIQNDKRLKDVDNFIKKSWADEIKQYNHYLKGECYQYQVYEKSRKVVNSCNGFYGDDFEKNGLMESAILSIGKYRNQSRKNRLEKIKTFIKHGVPLEIRNQYCLAH